MLPVYILDPRHFGTTRRGFAKTGPFRAKFLLESLRDLKSRLRELASDLVVRVGRPEVEIPKILDRKDGPLGSLGAAPPVVFTEAQATMEE